MDIKINDKYNVVFNDDFDFVEGIAEQKQILFQYLAMPKGSIAWNLNYGIDYQLLAKLLRIRDKEKIELFFTNIAIQLQLNLSGIDTTYEPSRVKIEFYFTQGDSLPMEFRI
ncbi:hypothetical protein [Candidatus Borreliella tachyglossi]|uniref:hypothetical protein n=1 Tax=Candidatus Borreliella tachyglossi TaxID=1964448 RepID=UPI004041B668